MVQVVPCITSARALAEPVLEACQPTATQFMAETHDTRARMLLAAWAGLGVFWIDQTPERRISASVATTSLRLL
jgi:hypothetical protein